MIKITIRIIINIIIPIIIHINIVFVTLLISIFVLVLAMKTIPERLREICQKGVRAAEQWSPGAAIKMPTTQNKAKFRENGFCGSVGWFRTRLII